MASKINGRKRIIEKYQRPIIGKISLGQQPDKHQLPSALTPHDEHPAVFLQRHLPSLRIPRGRRHEAVWAWAQSMQPETPAQSRVEIWARGGAKSSIAEQLCAYFACSLKRRFVLYVCGTQDQADLHVQAIAALLEKMGVPRAVNAYSASINWTAQKLQTANGFGVIGVGLNSRVRGARLEENRPDLIILDDVDGEHDTAQATQKKIDTISKAVLAAGATYATALFIQNKIHKDSAIAQTADGRAGILLGAKVTQEPAVLNLQTEQYFDSAEAKNRYRVTGGVPTWPEGQDLATAERQINDWGLRSFLQESQHEDNPDGGLWDRANHIDPYRVNVAPSPLIRIIVGVDPSGSMGTEAGIVAVGKAPDGHIYVLKDDSRIGTPNDWMGAAVSRYHNLQANAIAVERNYGGDMVKAGIRNIDARAAVIVVQASRGKLVRAEPVHMLYEEGKVHHVGHFPELEREMCQWQSGMESPNRLDALVWAITELMQPTGSFSQGGAAIY